MRLRRHTPHARFECDYMRHQTNQGDIHTTRHTIDVHIRPLECIASILFTSFISFALRVLLPFTLDSAYGSNVIILWKHWIARLPADIMLIFRCYNSILTYKRRMESCTQHTNYHKHLTFSVRIFSCSVFYFVLVPSKMRPLNSVAFCSLILWKLNATNSASNAYFKRDCALGLNFTLHVHLIIITKKKSLKRNPLGVCAYAFFPLPIFEWQRFRRQTNWNITHHWTRWQPKQKKKTNYSLTL